MTEIDNLIKQTERALALMSVRLNKGVVPLDRAYIHKVYNRCHPRVTMELR